MLTRSFAEIVRSSSQIKSSAISKLDQRVDQLVKVSGARNVTRVNVFDRTGIAEFAHRNIDAGRVRSGSIVGIIHKTDVVQKAGQNKRHNFFQVKPQIEIIVRFLVAIIVNHFGFVKLGIQLRSTGAGNWLTIQKNKKRWPIIKPNQLWLIQTG